MSYRKVGYLEQCWYIVQCWLRLKLHETKEARRMKKRKKYQHQEKPRMCDPGMCDNCSYIGDGNFICDKGPVSR